MKENIKMTKSMVMGYMSGSMGDIIKVGGIKGSSTALACTKFQARNSSMVSGKKVKGLNGSTLRQHN